MLVEENTQRAQESRRLLEVGQVRGRGDDQFLLKTEPHSRLMGFNSEYAPGGQHSSE